MVFIENRLLYGMKGPQPPADHVVPYAPTLERAWLADRDDIAAAVRRLVDV